MEMENPHLIKLKNFSAKNINYASSVASLCDSIISLTEEIQKYVDTLPKTVAQYPYSDAELQGDWEHYISERLNEITFLSNTIFRVATFMRDTTLGVENTVHLLLAFESNSKMNK